MIEINTKRDKNRLLILKMTRKKMQPAEAEVESKKELLERT